MFKLGPRQQKLVDALKSGKYAKTCGVLQDGDSFCCLGVASKIAQEDNITVIVDGDGNLCGNMLVPEVRDYFGFHNTSGVDPNRDFTALWEINDWAETFRPVIDAIETNPERYLRNQHNVLCNSY